MHDAAITEAIMAALCCLVPKLCLLAPKNEISGPVSITFVSESATMLQVGTQVKRSSLLGCTDSLTMAATMRNRLLEDWPTSDWMCVTRPL
eukprot:2663636-Pyramimonas_sp.AAC.1